MTRSVLLLVAAVLLAGCGASGGGITGLETLHAFPRQVGQAPAAWQAFAMETSPIGATEEWSFDVYAVCADA
jgi:hypothetical protein